MTIDPTPPNGEGQLPFLRAKAGESPVSEAMTAAVTRVARQQAGLTVLSLADLVAEASADVESFQVDGAVLVVPIMLDGKTIGTIQLYHPDGDWSEVDVAVLQTVSDQVAREAERLRLVEQAREQAALEAALAKVSQALQSADDVDTLLQRAAQILGQQLQLTHAVLEMTLPDQQTSDRLGINASGF